MSLEPRSSEHGPLRVRFADGRVEEWDRIWHHHSGMVTLYNVERVALNGGGSRVREGDGTLVTNREAIESIEYLRYGGA